MRNLMSTRYGLTALLACTMFALLPHGGASAQCIDEHTVQPAAETFAAETQTDRREGLYQMCDSSAAIGLMTRSTMARS